jgi:DNA-binding transcriptional LysR family regulator
MDIFQFRTFVVVAREGSVTKASEILFLSQPAISAHIKAMEEGLGLSLFHRTARGMSLTPDGQRLLPKAEQILAAHQELLNEASRKEGPLTGKLRLGAGTNSDNEALGKFLTVYTEHHPGVEIALKHGTSKDILAGIRNGSLDAGFYNEPGEPEKDIGTIAVSHFNIMLACAPGLVPKAANPDWKKLEELTWIYPASSACCGCTAENLFKANGIKPKKLVNVDRQDVCKALISSGIGIGLLHAPTAHEAESRGEIDILFLADTVVRVLFAFATTRKQDPILEAAVAIIRANSGRRPD